MRAFIFKLHCLFSSHNVSAKDILISINPRDKFSPSFARARGKRGAQIDHRPTHKEPCRGNICPGLSSQLAEIRTGRSNENSTDRVTRSGSRGVTFLIKRPIKVDRSSSERRDVVLYVTCISGNDGNTRRRWTY